MPNHLKSKFRSLLKTEDKYKKSYYSVFKAYEVVKKVAHEYLADSRTDSNAVPKVLTRTVGVQVNVKPKVNILII